MSALAVSSHGRDFFEILCEPSNSVLHKARIFLMVAIIHGIPERLHIDLLLRDLNGFFGIGSLYVINAWSTRPSASRMCEITDPFLKTILQKELPSFRLSESGRVIS